MFNSRYSLKNIHLGIKNAFNFSNVNNNNNTNTIKIDKILVVSKLSRYEFERMRYNNDKDLENDLRLRGTNFENVLRYHNLHKKFETKVTNELISMGINVDVVNRFNYNQDKVDWADIIIPIGGDGTFLLASSHVTDYNKPVIGFNSDPNRSEGHLCLPKIYSNNICLAIDKLNNGQFKWLLRNRIRIKILSQNCDIIPKYLHDVNSICEKLNPIKTNVKKDNDKVLPFLALNEVFVGEVISARVSHLQMRLDGSIEQTNMKCSGVCICTGTGSTSWNLSINRIPCQSVSELLKLLKIHIKEKEIVNLVDKYNKSFIFPADDERMMYTIRDLILAGVWPQPKGIQPRGFAKRIELKSNCYDASLVVDGGISFPFNDGTVVILEIKPEDQLRTVILNE